MRMKSKPLKVNHIISISWIVFIIVTNDLERYFRWILGCMKYWWWGALDKYCMFEKVDFMTRFLLMPFVDLLLALTFIGLFNHIASQNYSIKEKRKTVSCSIEHIKNAETDIKLMKSIRRTS